MGEFWPVNCLGLIFSVRDWDANELVCVNHDIFREFEPSFHCVGSAVSSMVGVAMIRGEVVVGVVEVLLA